MTEELIDPRLLDEAAKYLCELSLYDYVKEAWPHIESVPFVDSWHIGAICAHLQAVSRGQIKKLLINIPPGCSKSLLTSVLWPTWTWITKPQTRWFFASYDQELSTRDSLKCRALIQGSWYHGLWYDRFKFVNDQNEKTKFQNDKGGYRLATSVGGHGTGEHPDYIVCFPAGTLVSTDTGRKPIETLMAPDGRDKLLTGKVPRFTNSYACVSRPYNARLVRIRFRSGRSLECTPDHLIYVSGRGYTAASDLHANDEVVTDDLAMRELRERLCGEAIQASPSLQPSVSVRIEAGTVHAALRAVRQTGVPSSGPRCTRANLLLTPLPRSRHSWRCAPCLCRRKAALHRLRKDNSRRMGKTPRNRSMVLARVPQEKPATSARATLSYSMQPMRNASLGRQDPLRPRSVFLYAEMCQSRASRRHQGHSQRSLQAWIRNAGVPRRICRVIEAGSSERRLRVPVVPNDQSREWRESHVCASCRRERTEQQHEKCHQSLWVMPRQCSRRTETGESVARDSVFHVGPGSLCQRVYCLTVHGTANYYANGVLVHNCDDPHNVKRAESEANRQAVLEWWTLTMSTRGVSRGAARVIIMQRLHQKDLSGYVLEQGDYEHICLPMHYEPDRMNPTLLGFTDPRTVEGELLTPHQFSEPVLAGLEKELGSYGTAGQMQQRPAPKEGGMFQTAWFQLLPAAPDSMQQTVRWWDFAATEDEGDFTSGAKVGKTTDGRYVVLDIERGQWSSGERDRVIKSTAMRDGHTVHQWCEQEPGSGGKTVAENFVKMLDGYTARFQPTRGNKVRNAESLAAQAEVGSIYVVTDREGHRWNQALFEEFELFPFAEHDDIVDSISKAFNKVAAMSHAIIDAAWLRFFERRSNILTRLHVEKTSRLRVVDEGQCQRIAVVKCGASDIHRPRQTPWSVLQVWDYDPQAKDMFLRHAWRKRLQWSELLEKCRISANEWQYKRLLIVNDDVGSKLHAGLRGTSELVDSADRTLLELSVPLQDLLRKERVMLPCDRSDWRDALEAEWMAWTGAADEECVHITAASYAARYLAKRGVAWGGTVAGDMTKQTVPFTAARF